MGDIFKILFGAIAGPLLLVVAFFVMTYTFRYIGINPEPVISIVVALTPIWLPFVLFFLMFERWMEYVHLKFEVYNGRTTLRIKLPQEVFKSPEAMESVLAQIHNVNSADNLWQVYIDGKYPLVYSFELVSIGGDVRFYINVPTKKVKNSVEAQLYAQYPGIEVVEEEIDYTNEITWDPEKWEMMSFHMGKKEDHVFPLKTYIDFGMDKLPKEELKFEPMAAMLEQLSTCKPHERLWVQFLCRSHAKHNFKTGYIHKKDTWESEVFAAIDKIIGRNSKTKLGPEEREDQPRLTMGERDNITAMERNVGKYAYETAIRWMYITKTGNFNGNIIAPTIRTFSQYDIIKRNAIGVRWRTDFDYNWFSDYSGIRKVALKKKELLDYKKRKYVTREEVSHVDSPKIFTVEELATMFHIPGSSVVTPGLSRIPSTRKEAPPNLPIGLLT
jgi:hypothetical protein